MKILTVYTLNAHVLTLKAHNHIVNVFLSSTKIFEASETNSVDLDQTAPVGSSLIWVHNVCLYAYVKWTFSDAVIFLAF